MKQTLFKDRSLMPLDLLGKFICEHSPYLRTLLARQCALIDALRQTAPEDITNTINKRIKKAAQHMDADALNRALRQAKAETHLLCALMDVGGVWTVDDVMEHLTVFADAAMQASLLGAARALTDYDAVAQLEKASETGPLPGLFIIAMGKYGAFELNYSSDIDFTIFFDPQIAQNWLGRDPARTTKRIVRHLVHSMGAVTSDGYVFRTDIRLRPDPGSTNPAVSVQGAHIYYESVGQNWERAALIKARICAGDARAGASFLHDLQPFIWRRSLDFAAIEDIHAMKRQIHISFNESEFEASGHDVKLGKGGIREIEFFTQTQQLILGGRNTDLRMAKTCDALPALAKAGHISRETAEALCRNYAILRRAEHGAQMLDDQQTHTLPKNTHKRGAIAALTGTPELADFDKKMQQVFQQVHTAYSALFPQSKPLALISGSLVFTGIEDDPATLQTLKQHGFENPSVFLKRMREWHGGKIRATQTARARALLTGLGPNLVYALAKTGTPDHAFAVFTRFFESLNSGVQPLSLLYNRSKLLELLVTLLNTAPKMANTFSTRISVLDAILDPWFAQPLGQDVEAGAKRLLESAKNDHRFEDLLNNTRRTALEERLRVNVQILTDKTSPIEAAHSYSALAEAATRTLAHACARQMCERFAAAPADWAILGMGSLGAREMNDGSDLDLYTLYSVVEGTAAALSPAAYFSRFTQRLISALSAQTQEGALYEIDMKLRPSGQAGPVAVRWPAFVEYYNEKAWTWEVLALGRARVIATSSAAFQDKITRQIMQVLSKHRDQAKLKTDLADMLKRLRTEFKDASIWDLKQARGGLIETELLSQFIKLNTHHNTTTPCFQAARKTLSDAHALQLNLLQVLRLGINTDKTNQAYPPPLKALLAQRTKLPDFSAVEHALGEAQKRVYELSEKILT